MRRCCRGVAGTNQCLCRAAPRLQVLRRQPLRGRAPPILRRASHSQRNPFAHRAASHRSRRFPILPRVLGNLASWLPNQRAWIQVQSPKPKKNTFADTMVVAVRAVDSTCTVLGGFVITALRWIWETRRSFGCESAHHISEADGHSVASSARTPPIGRALIPLKNRVG